QRFHAVFPLGQHLEEFEAVRTRQGFADACKLLIEVILEVTLLLWVHVCHDILIKTSLMLSGVRSEMERRWTYSNILLFNNVLEYRIFVKTPARNFSSCTYVNPRILQAKWESRQSFPCVFALVIPPEYPKTQGKLHFNPILFTSKSHRLHCA